MFKQLKSTDIPIYREIISKEQNFSCAICGDKLGEGCALDHQHKLKSEENIVNGNGLIRGVLCRECNVLEGKIWNNTLRYKQLKTPLEKSEYLKKVISYYSKEPYKLIHPNEKPKNIVIGKREYNKVMKWAKDNKIWTPKKLEKVKYNKNKMSKSLCLLYEMYINTQDETKEF